MSREMPGQMTIQDYAREMAGHSPCAKGVEAFRRCRTRREVFELIASPKAVDFFLESVRDGWGPTPEEFGRVFRPYVNGIMTVVSRNGERKLKSQVWCNSSSVELENEVRWLILLGCRGIVRVGQWQVVKIFLDRHCDVEIRCEPNCIAYVENYGGTIREVKGECKITDK